MGTPTGRIAPKFIEETPPSEPQPSSPVTIQDIPPELMLRMFGFCKVQDVARSSLVCREWANLLDDDVLWKHFYARDFEGRTAEEPKDNYRERFLSRQSLSNFTHKLLKVTRQYFLRARREDVYLSCDQLVLSNRDVAKKLNLNTGEWGNDIVTRVITENRPSVALHGQLLITTSSSGIIRIRDLNDFRVRKTFQTKSFDYSPVSSNLLISNGILIAGHQSGSIRVWDFANEKCLHVFEDQHRAVEHLLFVDDETFISGSLDGEIVIYSLKEKNRVAMLKEGAESIFSLLLTSDQKLVVSCQGGKIRIWNLATQKCEHTITANDYCAPILHLTQQGQLISHARTGPFKVWNMQSGECEMTLNEEQIHPYSYVSTKPKGKILFSDDSGAVKMIDLQTKACKDLFQLKGSSLFEEFTDQGKFIVVRNTRKIHTFDFNASDREILEVIAHGFQSSENLGDEIPYFKMFEALPLHCQESIFCIFERLFKTQGLNSSSSVKDIFLKTGASLQLKAQAIFDYLNPAPSASAIPPYGIDEATDMLDGDVGSDAVAEVDDETASTAHLPQ